jgi:hypothetical protein
MGGSDNGANFVVCRVSLPLLSEQGGTFLQQNYGFIGSLIA